MANSNRSPLIGCTPAALFLILLVVLAWAIAPRVPEWLGRKPRIDAEPRAVTARGDLAADEQGTIELFQRVSPAVVHIQTSRLARRNLSLSPFEIPLGSGSGYVWDERGYVVTNAHVIAQASRAVVTLADGASWDATLVGEAREYDIAVLQIDAPRAQLRPIAVGVSKDLHVGQKVFAIGNPFGLDHTLTTGIISALGREIVGANRARIGGMIQTDAAINPGNSGGPLLDSAGRLIGMNTAIYTETGSNVGIGFALPVDVINAIVPQLIRSGSATTPVLGVRGLADQLKQRLGLRGVPIEQVEPESGAARAGLRSAEQLSDGQLRCDVITAVEGEKVDSIEAMRDVLVRYRPGDTVKVDVLRGGETLTLAVTLMAP
jgi:S1-C subfamily serine protease